MRISLIFLLLLLLLSIRHERVDLTFFNTHKNGSLFDFGDIPVPIQANITGHSYTEILPFHIGDGIQNISEIASVLPLPEHVLDFTQQDDTLFQYHESPIHVHHHEAHYQEDADLAADNSSSNNLEPEEQLNQEIPHVSHEDLLKIPVIGNTIVIDANKLSSSSSSSEEEDSASSSSSEENNHKAGVSAEVAAASSA